MSRSFFVLSALISPTLAWTAEVDFAHQIVPILKKHCVECHAGDKKKGGFSFNTREALLEGSENGAVVTLGKPEDSRLIEVLLTQDPDEQMPPKGERLSDIEVELLKAWVRDQAPWEEGFAFRKPAYEPPLKPRRPTLPEPVNGRGHPIDRILDQDLKRNHQAVPPALDDAAFARRVHLDLIGLLPEPEALQAFLQNSDPDKRTQLIRSLLRDDIAYAEHWLSFWNDLLRNDYGGTGFITGGRRQISKWLYDALITNKPADQMARELIAPPSQESRGFIDGIQWRGDVSAGQTVEIQFAQSVSQSFLGINMKCASCHDSFIDRWKLDEAYGLAAIYSKRPLTITRCDKPTERLAKASWLFPELGQVDPQATQPERLKQLAELLTHPENGRFTRTMVNRLWQRLMGRGIVHPVDAMQTEPWNADLLDQLAIQFRDQHYDLKQALEFITTSQAYQSLAETVAANTDDHGYRYAGPRSKRLTAEQLLDAIWQLTGTSPNKMDAPIMRGRPNPEAAKAVQLHGEWIWGDSAKQGPPPAGETIVLKRTLQLASAPLSASAVVTADNQFSLYVNGREVSAGDDWNRLEAVPLHTALKAGTNVIVLVVHNAGNQPNAAGAFLEARVRFEGQPEQTFQTDASWEFHPQTPTGKEGRLGALPAKGWKPVTVVKALPVWQATLKEQAPSLLAQAAMATTRPIRASLMKSDFLMRTLGRPNRDQIVSMRPDDLTTLEAMDLSNGAILTETLEKGAKNLLSQDRWKDVPSFTRWLFLAALCREPQPAELQEITATMGTQLTEHAIADTLWSVVMLPEFQRIR